MKMSTISAKKLPAPFDLIVINMAVAAACILFHIGRPV